MSIITVCKPFEVTGGADPQSFAINVSINSDSPNTSSLTAYYTINGGTQTGAQAFPATGAVSGQAYSVTASGVSTGDIVRVCVDAEVSTVEGDTGLVDFAGSVLQVAGDGCEVTHSIDAACNWTAVGEFIAPDCSALPASINCADLPYVVPTIPNANTVSVSISGTDYIYSGGSIIESPAGSGGNAIVTVTASNGNAAQDCVANISIVECPTNGMNEQTFIYKDCFGQDNFGLLIEETNNGVTTYLLDTPSTTNPVEFTSTCAGLDTVQGGTLTQPIYNQVFLHVTCGAGYVAQEQGCLI